MSGGASQQSKNKERLKPEQLMVLSPSAKLVYKVLKHDHPLTQQEIRNQTRLPKRTTRHAIVNLSEGNLIEAQVNIHDPRQQIYKPVYPSADEEDGTKS